MQRFWEHCEDILGRAAAEVPEASLDADTQAQRLQHAKLEQVPSGFSFAVHHQIAHVLQLAAQSCTFAKKAFADTRVFCSQFTYVQQHSGW